jgi:hypothetical protein
MNATYRPISTEPKCATKQTSLGVSGTLGKIKQLTRAEDHRNFL